MTLASALQNMKAEITAKTPDDIREKMEQATTDLANSGIVDRSLKVGEQLPVFSLANATGQTIHIEDKLANGPVVITFYRGSWCPYCNQALRALQQIRPEIQAAGGSLVAITPETPDNSLSTTEKNELTFEVLSDVGNKVARQLGLVFQLPEELRPIYQGFGIDLPGYNGDETFELPLPGTYVVAPNREIVYAFADADYTKRAEPTDVVAAVQALKA